MHIGGGAAHIRADKGRLKLVVSRSRGCESVDAILIVRARMKDSLMRTEIRGSISKRGGIGSSIVKDSRYAKGDIVPPPDNAWGAERSVRLKNQAATEDSGISITPHTVWIGVR
jgi:hypothetical protein